MIKTVLHGAGRMARGVLAELLEHPGFELIAVVSRSKPDDEMDGAQPRTTESSTTQSKTAQSNSAQSNTDWSNKKWRNSLDEIDTEVDLLIDFTLPDGPATAAFWCQQNSVAMLSGTTGLSDKDKNALKSASTEVAVLWASNMSQGIALISALARQAAASIGEIADITISDIHHQHKQDAPSGTALTLAEALMDGRAQAVGAEALDSGSTISVGDHEVDREEGEIAFISVRKGEVIGEHTISFEMAGEIVEISHKARERSVFAKGALNAGAWLCKQKPGYYSTSDWLNIG